MLLEVHCVEFEICDIIVNFTIHIVQRFNIKAKMIWFCVHNTNTNCGKAQNQSNNNVLTKLGNYGAEMYLELVVCMHNSQLCVQRSCSAPPIKIEVALPKIYKRFYIFIRAAEL